MTHVRVHAQCPTRSPRARAAPRQVGAQLSPRVVQCLVERTAGGAEPLGQHVERHAVERECDQHLALVLGEAVVDRALERLHQLPQLDLAFGPAGGIAHQRPNLRLEHHLPFLPCPPAKAHAGLEQGELVGPGGEAARAAVVVELGEHRHEGVIRGLDGDVVELLAAYASSAARRRATSKRAARSSSSCRRATASSRTVPVERSASSQARESDRARSGSPAAAPMGGCELMPAPRLTPPEALNTHASRARAAPGSAPPAPVGNRARQAR